MCVRFLRPLLFPYVGVRTRANPPHREIIQKPSVQIPKAFHQHGIAEKTMI